MRESLRRHGDWLFRRRSYVPVALLPFVASGRNRGAQVADTLNTTGPYSIVRNPLYLGNALMWAGVVLYARTAWLALAVGLAFWIVYERIVYAEEEFPRATGRWHADPVWLSVAAATAVLYLALRTLKHHTRVLHVEGR